MHGDGTSLWTLTHHADFARGVRRRCWATRARVGDVFHITSDDVLTWDQIAHGSGRRRGRRRRSIVHVPSDAIAAADPEWGAGLLGDKAHSMVFDNSKLRTVVPGLSAPPSRSSRAPARSSAGTTRTPPVQQIDDRLDALMDKLVATYRL